MKSSEYWKKRSEQIAKLQFDKADAYELTQTREYNRAIASIKRDVEAFYQRYAINNEINLADARKQLSDSERKEFRMSLEEFTDKAKDNADGRWTKELNNVYYRMRVSRFEALQVQINQQVEVLAGSRQKGTAALLGDVYSDAYHRTLYELQKGTGIGVSFAKIHDEGLQTILGTKLDGRNWSQRIWDDRSKLRQELQTKLSQSFIRGDSAERTIKDLTERMSVSRSNADRLIQTESAFFVGQATMNGYKESGIVQQYEILATLDSRTSTICRGLDGKVFSLSEMAVGVNYPPFHVRCRTTTVAAFDDEVDAGERIARDRDGKSYFVPGDISFPDWKKQYVDSPESGIIESEKHFTDVLNKTPSVTPEYKKVLLDRFTSGSDKNKQVYAKYITGNVVNRTNESGAHYDPSNQVINMDFASDYRNPRGPGATYFHEHAHYVDNMAAIKALNKQTYDGVSHIAIGTVGARDFQRAILQDVQDYVSQFAAKRGITQLKAQDEIHDRFSQNDSAIYSAVSDVYGGATGNRLRGDYGHSKDYWKQLPHALEKEAFAHMFEASFDPTGKRRTLIEEYLPSAFKVFKKIMEAI